MRHIADYTLEDKRELSIFVDENNQTITLDIKNTEGELIHGIILPLSLNEEVEIVE